MHFLYNDTSFLSPMGIYGSKSFHKVRYHDYRCYALGFFFTGVGFVSIKNVLKHTTNAENGHRWIILIKHILAVQSHNGSTLLNEF